MSGRHLVLVGLMGSGKSTVGRLLAQRLSRPFADADQAVEARAGRTVDAIFAAEGERGFRTIEAVVVADLLSASEPSVVALGGGAVLDASTRARLRERATTVWLRASPEALVARLGAGRGRPLLQGADGVAATIERLQVERAPFYDEVADATVDVDGIDPEAVAERVVAVVGEMAA